MITPEAERDRPVLILGAGVNGASTARELLLQGIPVVLVDQADIATGASSKSSRLIHGGLRYLEYRETDLVKESLAERRRLLRLAPQFVQPLRLFIPIENRFSGFLAAARRFLGLGANGAPTTRRGLWIARLGLLLYDLYARDPTLPRHRIFRVGDAAAPPVNPDRFRFCCSFFDGQMLYPERFILALLEDARRIAADSSTRFEVHTYTRTTRDGDACILHGANGQLIRLRPSVLLNATGAWGDFTLRDLPVESQRLFGGTKGSHFLTFHEGLAAAIGNDALYVEADDGRLVFILPLAGGVYVGTTDEPFDDPPDQARATREELEYLLGLVNEVFPQVGLSPGDLAMHCSGVRPLPYSDASTPSAITRRHFIVRNDNAPFPVYTLVGGKLTTCRALGEEMAEQVLADLGRTRIGDSRDRVLPGGEHYPDTNSQLVDEWNRIALESGWPEATVRAIWTLIGTRTSSLLADLEQGGEILAETDLPIDFVRWCIREEWPRRLADLVERRLMLIYRPRLSRDTLKRLAGLLVEAGLLLEEDLESEIDHATRRLRDFFGKNVARASD